jgi:ribosome-associated translation inhibitor RaiA
MIHGQAQWSEPYAAFDSENAKITKQLRCLKRRRRGHDHQSPTPEGLDVQELVFAAES